MAKPEAWSEKSLSELADHIEETYHESLRRQLPLLRDLIQEAQAAGGGLAVAAKPLAEAFGMLQETLEDHLVLEEDVLFPYIHQLERASQGRNTALLDPKIHDTLMQQHAQADEAVMQLRVATTADEMEDAIGSLAPELLEALRLLAREMDEHMRLENEILFPGVTEMEQKLGME
jgi:regulator of cell morphogenesis and NO signaling